MRRLAPPGQVSGSFEVSFEGKRFRGDLGSFIDWSIYFFGAYSPHELALLDRLSRRLSSRNGAMPVFADIGANVGNHTLFMSSRASRIVAFEPFAPVRAQLEEQISINRLDNVLVLPFGLGDSSGAAEFFFVAGHDNAGIGTTIPQDGWSRATVELRQGDSVPELARANILKIDVEGAEAAVLRGLASTLQRTRPAILMELSDPSRRAFGSERGLRDLLYPGASILSVRRGRWHSFVLAPFRFEDADEILITPSGLLWDNQYRHRRRSLNQKQ